MYVDKQIRISICTYINLPIIYSNIYYTTYLAFFILFQKQSSK